MSVSDELLRIIHDKDDIKSSIENKGVAVPESAHLIDYAAYVDSINGGEIGTYDTTIEDSLSGLVDGIILAKENLRKAIYNKGVIVPSDSSIDKYSFYIDQIQTTKLFNIQLICDPEYGTVEGSGTYPENTLVHIKCTPKSGYKFITWSDGNTEAERDILLTQNITLEATLEASDIPNYFYIKDYTGTYRTVSVLFNKSTETDLHYSYDGIEWIEVSDDEIPIDPNSKVYFKGENPNGFSKNTIYSSANRFSGNGSDYGVGGNINSLISSEDFEAIDTIPDLAFSCMLQDSNLVNIDDLVLPAETLGVSCYQDMFKSASFTTIPVDIFQNVKTIKTRSCSGTFAKCTNLTVVPEFPVAELASYCFTYMFEDCTSLVEIPIDVLSKYDKLTEYCYTHMFDGCTGLTTTIDLPAEALTNYCYSYMFHNCSSLTVASELKATSLAPYCCYYMFSGCTSLTTVPKLSATTLASNCYNNMFRGCTELTTAPDLPAETLVTACYNYMFRYCSKLNYIKCDAKGYSSSNCTNYWVDGVASSGTFVSNDEGILDWNYGVNGIPNNWETTPEKYNYFYIQNTRTTTITATIKKNNTSAPAISLQYFKNGNWLTLSSSSITTAGTTISTIASGGKLFLRSSTTTAWSTSTGYYYTIDCSDLFNIGGELVSLCNRDSSNLKTYHFSRLFSGSKVVNASNLILPNNTNTYCYYYMFNGCTSLSSAPQLPATTLASNCYYSMFRGCTSLYTAPVLPAITLVSNCYSYMFYGCSKLNYIKAMFTTTPSTNYTNNWVNGVASSGSYYKNSNATYTGKGVSAIPSGWTVYSTSV